ncbi:5757_t:CDS:1 [Paraglomus brasilianum]|uniref:5757_t:CDS:1 n=1 Tax=Paraglomus brasilianum TaxID=144538 RepID=A0A9N9G9X8_9GLOM|nr:5757_t:CDS:1 [Paraglomus brasilianum]
MWCSIAVSILWRNPFDPLPRLSSSLIYTYLNCLDTDAKLRVRKILGTFEEKKLTYDYTVYLRYLHVAVLHKAVRQWSSDTMGDVGQEVVFSMVGELFKLLVTHSSKIICLSVDVRDLCVSEIGSYLCIQVKPFPPAALSYLQEFICCGYFVKKSLFENLAKVAKNIKRMSINHYQDDRKTVAAKGFAELIESQNGLELFELSVSDPSKLGFLPSLSTQAKSLTQVIFQGIDFGERIVLECLVECKNLERLFFCFCENVTERVIEPLTNTTLPKLRDIKFHLNNRPPLNLPLLFENSGLTIKALLLSWRVVGSNVLPVDFIRRIIVSCPNISICEGNLNTDDLITLLNHCHILKQLVIHNSNRSETRIDEFLPEYGRLMPPTLTSLIIYEQWTFSADALERFLSYNNVNLRVLCFTYSALLRDEHIKVLIRYAITKRTLKVLNLGYFSNISKECIDELESVVEDVVYYQ